MPDLIDRLYQGETGLVAVEPDGTMHTTRPSGAVLLAGSFNPLHEGHEKLLAAAARVTGRSPAYEVSAVNVDKPSIDPSDLRRRLQQFKGKSPVVVTWAPTFGEKAALVPDTVFALGYDTAVRLFDERYYPPYDPDSDPCGLGSTALVVMDQVRKYGGSFAVAGRVGDDGKFYTLRDIDVPAGFSDMLVEIPEAEFREDISSTEIRERQGRE